MIPGGLGGGPGKRGEFFQQRPSFVEPTSRDHFLSPGVNALIERGFFPVNPNPDRLMARSTRPLLLEIRDRLARKFMNLQRPHHPASVVAIYPLRRGRVERREAFI